MHWADTSTRELLALLARQQQGDVVLLLTLRTDESPAPAGLSRYLAELVRRGDHRVALQPLSREQQARQISDILGVPPHRQLLDDVYDRAEGNPFFAEELLALAQQGDAGLPATVRDLLVARLESLSPATQQVLRTASVIGRTAPHRLLEAVVDVSGDRLEDVLRSAVGAHVLHADGDGLTFRHALLQEAIAASLLPGEAARTHRRIAEALSDGPRAGRRRGARGRAGWPGTGPRPAIPPRHSWRRSRRRCEAGDALAFAEALSHYERALELVEVVPDAEALLDLPRARLLALGGRGGPPGRPPRPGHRAGPRGDRPGRPRGPAPARLAARAAGPLPLDVRGHPGRAGVVRAGRGAGARRTADPAAGRRAERALADADAGRPATRSPRCWPARRSPSPRRCRTGGPSRATRGATSGVALAYTGRVEEGIAELREARRIAEEQFDDVDDIARAMVNLQAALYDHGRLEEAAELALESVRVTEALGLQRRKGVWSRCDAAQVLLVLGRLGRGRPSSSTRPASCSPRASTPSAPTWWRASCGCAGATSTRHALLLERAEAAGVPDHRPAPARPAVRRRWWRSRPCRATTPPRPAGPRTGCAGWTTCVHPAHVAPTARRGRDRGGAGRSRPGWRTPGRCSTGREALLAATPAPGTPAEIEVLRGRGRALRRRRCLAQRGRGVGGAGRALPGGVRAPPDRGGAAGHRRRPRGRRRAPAHGPGHGAPDRCRRPGRSGPRTSGAAPA